MPKGEFTVLLDNSASEGGKQNKVMPSQGQEGASKPSFTPKEGPMSREYDGPRTAMAGGDSPNATPMGFEAPEVMKGVSSMDEMFDLARRWTGHPYLSPSLVMSLGEPAAIKAIGKRHGSTKRAIDCSGFVQEVLNYAGIDPPGDQTAEGLFKHFKSNGTPLMTPQKGALIFFEPVNKSAADSGKWDAGRSITHVAFSLGGGRIMDSAGGIGVSERNLPPEGRFKYHYVMPNYKFGQKGSV